MPLLRVQPDDDAALAATVEILEAARRLDDPGSPAPVLELQRRWLRFGWDLRPDEWYLYSPEPGAAPVGLVSIDLPSRDNLHLVWADITVHPAHRRHGHGSAMMAEVLRRTDEAGRTTIWVGGPSDDPAPTAFAGHHGFRFASPEARRKQYLGEVPPEAVAALRHEAETAASEYELQRLLPPLTDELMTEVAEVAESINDAPMGDLTYEPEVFDLGLMRDVETAARGRGDHVYRVVARHRPTGRLGGHTVVAVNPLRPERGVQCDTAVSREHRGRRLGLLLKIEMMAWLGETEPQLEYVETSNQAGNSYMIDVNEALGYRLDRTFHVFERQLATAPTRTEPAGALATA